MASLSSRIPPERALRFAALALAACALRPARGTEPVPPGFTEAKPGEWNLSPLPRSLQSNPRIDLSVITEMTPAGRKARVPTAEHPMFYLPESAGYHDQGQGIPSEHILPVPELQRRLEASLHAAHYLPAAPGHGAGLILIFTWGAANRLDPDTPDVDHQNLLTRAALVGGERFALEYQKVLRLQDDLVGGGVKMHPTPVESFMDRSYKIQQLVEESRADCYYVVVSAYDGAAYAKQRRVLLWRTKMTTTSQGLAMEQTLPTLITSGSPYFGRDMTEASTLRGRLVPNGQVVIGTPEVVPQKSNPPPP